MSDQDSLRKNSKRCWRQARAATDPREKAAWLELAVGWTKLELDLPVSSEEAEQIIWSGPTPRSKLSPD